jgi:hypothetical protein
LLSEAIIKGLPNFLPNPAGAGETLREVTAQAGIDLGVCFGT